MQLRTRLVAVIILLCSTFLQLIFLILQKHVPVAVDDVKPPLETTATTPAPAPAPGPAHGPAPGNTHEVNQPPREVELFDPDVAKKPKTRVTTEDKNRDDLDTEWPLVKKFSQSIKLFYASVNLR